MSDSSAAADEQLYEVAVPDAENTLGGIKDDTEPDHPSVLIHLVKSLMPGQDLTRVTIPSFFLEPRSLLERMSDLFMHPDLLLEAPMVTDPAERMLAVVKWYLSGWHYKTIGVKKPYNPIVGETFAACWKHEDGTLSQYFSEQVEHRPPISAIYFENRAHHVAITAHIWTKSQFSAPQTTKSILDGAGRLVFSNLGEEYWITLPTYFAHNMLIGTLRMEIGDTASIVCAKTGLRADLDFTQRGTFTGADRERGVDGKVYRTGKPGSKGGEAIASISGHWDTQLFVERSGKAKSLFLDVSKTPVMPKRVLPAAQQGPWESRKLWEATTQELRSRPVVDWSVVDREKLQLEEEQRLLACHSFKPGETGYEDWPTKKFHKRSVTDPIKGTVAQHYTWDDWDAACKPYEDGQSQLNALALSRSLPDSRGGWRGAGAVEGDVAKTRSIKLSDKRQADFAKQDREKAGTA